jgi:hypothetical protein
VYPVGFELLTAVITKSTVFSSCYLLLLGVMLLLTLRFSRCRLYVPPKRRAASELHVVTTQKTPLFNCSFYGKRQSCSTV